MPLCILNLDIYSGNKGFPFWQSYLKFFSKMSSFLERENLNSLSPSIYHCLLVLILFSFHKYIISFFFRIYCQNLKQSLLEQLQGLVHSYQAYICKTLTVLMYFRLLLLQSCANHIGVRILTWLEIFACKWIWDVFVEVDWKFWYNFFSYCPGGPDSDFEYSTQSYTGYEVWIVLM